jgi:mannose-6-phosphate isomerase-like protein (cupin superfamily)
MKYFRGNIEQLTLDNNFFRKVIFTGSHSQLVLMSLKVGEEIGLEIHDNIDQFFRIEQGQAKFVIEDEVVLAEAEHAVVVPAGTKHNVINTGSEDLKLYTIYSPANHKDGTIHETKAGALEAEKNHRD